MFVVEQISNKIAMELGEILNLDQDGQEIIAYGAFGLIQIICSTLCVVIFGIIFKVLVQALLIIFAIAALRKYSGGAHASTPNICIVVGTAAAISLALILKNFILGLNYELIAILTVLSMLFSYYMVYKYAPVDSPAKPIVREEKRSFLKKRSILVLNIFSIIMLVLALMYFIYGYKPLITYLLCICTGATWQAFTLTAMGHNVLGKIDGCLLNLKWR